MIIFVGTDYEGGRQFHVWVPRAGNTEDLVEAIRIHELLPSSSLLIQHDSLPLLPSHSLRSQQVVPYSSVHLYLLSDLREREKKRQEEKEGRGRYVTKNGKERLRRRSKRVVAQRKKEEEERVGGYDELRKGVEAQARGAERSLESKSFEGGKDEKQIRHQSQEGGSTNGSGQGDRQTASVRSTSSSTSTTNPYYRPTPQLAHMHMPTMSTQRSTLLTPLTTSSTATNSGGSVITLPYPTPSYGSLFPRPVRKSSDPQPVSDWVWEDPWLRRNRNVGGQWPAC
ncbi:hypothetical protein IAR55_006274 [Kwoniella newhampshirensis]|uniref:BZIP domain-containing protein n=1 Tax=Kwoniella newhampshirensis TaxID=1651941 RepID=A0AAW0YK79_9TREE